MTAELPSAELGGTRSSGLDGLRAAASLMVALFHTIGIAGMDYGPLQPLIAGGSTGVWVFFALSGYLLYRPFLKRAVDLRSYALKRASRILPAYYVALVALVLLTGSRLPLEHPVEYLTITSSYLDPLRQFLGPAWTLSAELAFYVTLPLIARLAAGRNMAVLLTLGLASMVGSVVQRYTATETTFRNVDVYPLVFFAFVPGMLLAVLEVRRPAIFAGLAQGRYLLLGLLYIALGMLTSAYPLPLGAMFGTPLVMGWLLHHRLPGARALVFAGGASYALYLWHADLMTKFGMAGLAIAIVGSALSWALVERPILNWAHRRSGAWRTQKLRAESVATP